MEPTIDFLVNEISIIVKKNVWKQLLQTFHGMPRNKYAIFDFFLSSDGWKINNIQWQ